MAMAYNFVFMMVKCSYKYKFVVLDDLKTIRIFLSFKVSALH